MQRIEVTHLLFSLISLRELESRGYFRLYYKGRVLYKILEIFLYVIRLINMKNITLNFLDRSDG